MGSPTRRATCRSARCSKGAITLTDVCKRIVPSKHLGVEQLIQLHVFSTPENPEAHDMLYTGRVLKRAREWPLLDMTGTQHKRLACAELCRSLISELSRVCEPRATRGFLLACRSR